MKNNELKPLFRNVDMKVSPVRTPKGASSVFELRSLYNDLNNAIPFNMIQSVPVDVSDVNIIRDNLCVMFESRVKNKLHETIKILCNRLFTLEERVNKFIRENIINEDDYNVFTVIDLKGGFYGIDVIVDDIVQKMPYITDLMFYFNINEDFVCIKTMALSISTLLYNNMRFELGVGDKNLDFEEIEIINNTINDEFKSFANSMIDVFHTLLKEAQEVYFKSGDFVPDKNGNLINSINLEEEFCIPIPQEEHIPAVSQAIDRVSKLMESIEDTF